MNIYSVNVKKAVVLFLTVLYMLIFVGMIIAHPRSEQFYQDFNNIYQIIPPLFAGVCSLSLANKEKLASRWRCFGWLLLGLAAFSFTAGQITWTYYETLLRVEVSSPGLQDLGYSAVKPLFIVGLLVLFHSMPIVGRARLLVDSALAASSVAVISWYFIIEPLWNNDAISLTGKVISVMYPIGDVAILFCAIALWGTSTTNASLRRSINFLFGGVLLIAMADVLYWISSLNDSYQTGSWFDWAWSFGWLSIAYACILPLWWPMPSPAIGEEPAPPSAFFSSGSWSWSRLLAPYITLTIAFIIVVRNHIGSDGRINVSVLAAALLLMPLVLLRQVLFLFENKELTEQKKIQEILRKANEDLELRVAERTAELELSNQQLSQANQEAVMAREEAEAANRAKSEFLSRMSHELRTPLNAILGFGQLLQMRTEQPRDQEAVGHILKGGQHLLHLIDEVLDISRIENGRLQLSIEPIPLPEVLRETLELITPLASQRQVQVHACDVMPDVGAVLADQQRLKQVLINLLSNAIKYNRTNGNLFVECHIVGDQDEQKVRILVRDDGPGIATADIDKVFVPFERLGAEGSTIEGTGLGLALCKGMMEAMGGKIGLESEPGKGTTAWIELHTAVDPLIQVQQDSIDFIPLSAQEDVRTILLIEDNLANQNLVKHIFANQPQIQLMAAMQGCVGLELAQQHHPDLILLDLHLPDITGHEVLGKLRVDAGTADIPVVIVSADATLSQIERLKEMGAVAYLTKPLNIAEFLQTIDCFLRSSVIADVKSI